MIPPIATVEANAQPVAGAKLRAPWRVVKHVVLVLATLSGVLRGQDAPLNEPLEVRRVQFEGNESIDESVLRNAIATSQSFGLRFIGLGEKRFFNETELRRDVIRVRALYRQSGFLDAQVDASVTEANSGVWIRFEIVEGAPIVVTSLTVEGLEGARVPGRVVDRLPLREGRPFDRLRLRASSDTLRAALADVGHPFAEIYTNFDEDRVARTAQVRFVVDPGQRSRIGEVVVVGAEKIPPEAVQRRLLVQPGQIYRERDIYASQLDLYRSNVYNNVSVVLWDSIPPPDSLVRLRVRVSEAPLHRLRLGAGYGTTDCFRTTGQWGLNNFLGGGRQALVSGRLSRIGVGGSGGLENKVICSALADDLPELLTLNYNVSVSLTQPYFIWRRTSATVSVFAERQSEFQVYRRDAIGTDLSVTRQLGPQTALTLSYALAKGRTSTDPAKQCAFFNVCSVGDTVFNASRITSRIALAFVRDTRNSLFDPNRGMVLRAQVAFSDKGIGSDSLSQFLKGSVEFARYHRIARGHTFSWRVHVGAQTVPFLTFFGGGGRIAPPEERFYAGGATTVRGFAQNGLGPVVHVLERVDLDPNGTVDSIVRTSPVGGNGVMYVNAEYRFPIGGRLSGAVFIDAGQVFANGRNALSVDKLRVTPGAGLRVDSPLGPVRLDVAYSRYGPTPGRLFRQSGNVLELVPQPGDGLYTPAGGGVFGHLRIHFSIGQAF